VKILYVEDDPTARRYVGKGLEEHGHVVDSAEDGGRGLKLALAGAYDLIILDIGLPELDGFEVIERLRERDVRTPVLCLSARSEVVDRIRGLNLGADDYLANPFAFAELLARVQAIARRGTATPPGEPLRLADLELDVSRRAARRAGVPIELTQKEFALLEYLLRYKGQVLSRTMITEEVWGYRLRVLLERDRRAHRAPATQDRPELRAQAAAHGQGRRLHARRPLPGVNGGYRERALASSITEKYSSGIAAS
jgi:two-component system copper resistance phosphate regulon response regulator CusR